MSTEQIPSQNRTHTPKEEETESPPTNNEDDVNDGRSCFRVLELSFIFALTAVALVVEFVAMPQTQRPIPVQIIDNDKMDTITYIRNSSFDLEEGDESVDDLILILVGLVIPFLLQFAIMATRCEACNKHRYERYNTLCSYFLSFGLTLLTIDVIKLYTGVLRPHFYQACRPDATYELCTNEDESELQGARDSFPSGHAGLSMAGLGSFALYLHRRYGVASLHHSRRSTAGSASADTERHAIARLWSFASVLPVWIALYIGVSRIHDDYHHPADVVAGTAVGGIVAYFCHWVYFLE